MGSADGPVSSPGRGRPPGDETCGRRKPASAGTEACNCLLPEVALTAPSLQTWRWKGKGNHCDPGGRVRPRWQELAWSELRVHSGEGSGELSARSQVRVPLGALLPSRPLAASAPTPSRPGSPGPSPLALLGVAVTAGAPAAGAPAGPATAWRSAPGGRPPSRSGLLGGHAVRASPRFPGAPAGGAPPPRARRRPPPTPPRRGPRADLLAIQPAKPPAAHCAAERRPPR